VNYIVVCGNPVEGFSFFGSFIYEHQAREWAEANVNETTWVVAAMDEPDFKVARSQDVSFHVNKVEVARGTFWTVIKFTTKYTEEGSVVVTEGGDHHWLSVDAAEAAKRVYQICSGYHEKSPSETMEAFRNYFDGEEFPIVEPLY